MMVKEAALNLGLDLTTSSVLSDFEQALINALRLNFPTAEHRGCYHHYSQAIWRKVQALGLKRIVGKPHPNIFEIVDVIRKEQATTEMKLEQYAAGVAQPPRKKRYIQ